MGYYLYSTLFVFLSISTSKAFEYLPYNSYTYLGAAVAFMTRSRWISNMPRIPGTSFIYSRLPTTFAGDIESGFSSSAFDLSGNVASGDSRAGLDDSSKREIQKIMRNRRVNFDEARRIYTEGRFAQNNIGPDGLPRDPKLFTFS
jgi:hypothetical protein